MITKGLTSLLQHKILFFLFIAAWLNLPGLIYERFGLDSLLAYHGKNLIPFFIPVLVILLIGLFHLNYQYQNKSALYVKKDFLIFYFMISILICIELVNSGIYGYRFLMRTIQPIIFLYFFYFFYDKYSIYINSPNGERLINYSIYVLVAICIIHLGGYLGLFPHYRGTAGESSIEGVEALASLKRIDTIQLNLSSYYALFLISITLFFWRGSSLGKWFRLFAFAVAFLVIYWNQTRGALYITFAFFAYKLLLINMPIFIRIIMSLVFVLGILVMAFTFSDLRIFDLVDSSGLERILMVIMSYEQIIQYPFLGMGAGFELQFRLPAINPKLMHSYILRYAIAYGLIGFITILIFYLSLHRKIKNKYLLVSLGLFLGIGLFETYIQWWLSLVPLIASYASQKEELLSE